jgi:hypothetical protein
MILACEKCSHDYLMDGWVCPTCTPVRKVAARPRYQDLIPTPVLTEVLARTDLRLAIAQAVPLLKTGRVAAALDVLERTA